MNMQCKSLKSEKGRTGGAIDFDLAVLLGKKKTNRMLKLRNVYPRQLNNRIEEKDQCKSVKTKSKYLVGKAFPSLNV